MGKTTICIGENKGADLSAFVFANQIVQILFYLKAKFQASHVQRRFVSDLFGNHIVGLPTRRLICVDNFFSITMQPMWCVAGPLWQHNTLCPVTSKFECGITPFKILIIE